MFFLLMMPMAVIPGAFFALVFHEWVKARVSTALGDPVPKNNGFLTWNPFKFFEPIGFLLMIAIGFGWGQPVPTSSFYYRDRRKGVILTYTAPIVANLLVGMLAAFLWSQLTVPHFFPELFLGGMLNLSNSWVIFLHVVVQHFALLNIGLAVLNLFPVFPMAGSKLIHLFASPDTSMRLNYYEKPMLMIFILMVSFGMVQLIVYPIRSFFFFLVWF